MVGRFIAPLTLKGRTVRDLISEVDASLPPDAGLASRAIQERFVQMLYNPSLYDEFGERQHRLLKVRHEIESRFTTEGSAEGLVDTVNGTDSNPIVSN